VAFYNQFELDKQMKNNLQLKPSPLARERFIARLRTFTALKYADDNNVRFDGDDISGTLNCFGVPVVGLLLEGMLDDDLDYNFSFDVFGKDKGHVLWDLIHQNCDPAGDFPHQWLPGDILLYRWTDVLRKLKTVHHVGVWIGERDKHPNGRMIHALDRKSGGLDKIYEQDMTGLELARLDQVWRIRALV
jgi:hypothetical protein